MTLNISVAARNRQFSKEMMRMRPDLERLSVAFEEVEMVAPLQTATLILITDEDKPGSLREVESEEGIFQVIAGCPSDLSHEELRQEISKIVLAVVEMSSFAKPDRDSFINVVDAWK